MSVDKMQENIRAYTELKCLLKYFPKEMVSKIPTKLKKLIAYRSDDKYNIYIDEQAELLDYDLSPQTLNMLVVLNYSFWSTEEEKEELLAKFIANDKNKESKDIKKRLAEFRAEEPLALILEEDKPSKFKQIMDKFKEFINDIKDIMKKG